MNRTDSPSANDTSAAAGHAARLAELDRAYPPGAALDAELALERGDLLRFVGRIGDSEAVFAALAREATDPRHRVLAEVGLANASCARANWAAARARLTAILESEGGWAAPAPALAAQIRATLASALYNEHRFVEAREQLERALVVMRQYADRKGESVAVISLGIVALALGDMSGAFALLDEGRAVAHRIGLRRWEAMALSYIAMTRHLSGDLPGAATAYDSSLEMLNSIGLRRAEGLAHFGRAMLRIEQGRLDAASDDLHDALFNERVTSPDYEPLLAGALALVAAARADETAVRHHLRYAEGCLQHQGTRFADELAALERGISGDTAAPFERCVTPEARLIERAFAALHALRAAPRVVVSAEYSRFSVDGAEPVDLTRRKSLKRLFQALCEKHADPARPALTLEGAIQTGWPGQRVVDSSGATRVYTAMATLRRLGLEDVLERRADGYALSRGCVVVVDTSEPIYR